MNVKDCDRILVVKPSSLGDIVHTIPAVLAIHRSAPEAEIHWLVNTEWTPLLEGLPFLQNVISFPRKQLRGAAGILAANQWANAVVKPIRPDLTIDFQGLLRSGWLTWKSSPRHSVGFDHTREGARLFYDEKVPVKNWKSTHAVDRYWQLAEACGVEKGGEVSFELPAGEELKDLQIPDPDSFILLHPFSRGQGKSLSLQEVAEFCRDASPFPVVIVGAGVPELPAEILPGNAVDLLGKTSIAQLITLIRKAAWTVSVDSGPMHLAAGITEKILSIHTWSDPKVVGPYPGNAWIWRDETIVQQKKVKAGEFPERRDLRDSFADSDRLLPRSAIGSMVAFVKESLDTTGR